jgi:hypothetical protein
MLCSGTCYKLCHTKKEEDVMFRFQNELRTWNGQSLSLVDLQKRLSRLRVDHISELPPEIGVRDLLILALNRQWIIEEQSGQLRIQA